ncbi:hypothetical protein CHCC14820_2532 [Bacillus paralicheniformis]|nr:hypothetical protein CHCC14820_2532 [Bacillus paralicheniformis]
MYLFRFALINEIHFRFLSSKASLLNLFTNDILNVIINCLQK